MGSDKRVISLHRALSDFCIVFKSSFYTIVQTRKAKQTKKLETEREGKRLKRPKEENDSKKEEESGRVVKGVWAVERGEVGQRGQENTLLGILLLRNT